MIHLDAVSKTYRTRSGNRQILRDVSLNVSKGAKIGILGSNGSGKSTLIRLIGGAELPTSGSVTRYMTVSWPLAFTGAFQGSLTGVDNLRFVCRIYGANYTQALDYVESFAELGNYLREPYKTYSSGMKARLAFAVSMAIEFDCFLIDEIVSVGDSRFHEKCRIELMEKRRDRAIVLVSHHPWIVRNICTEVLVLNAGVIHKFNSIDDSYSFYDSLVNSDKKQ
jgi:capsular polysaccharide transport system ATP-binding protein